MRENLFSKPTAFIKRKMKNSEKILDDHREKIELMMKKRVRFKLRTHGNIYRDGKHLVIEDDACVLPLAGHVDSRGSLKIFIGGAAIEEREERRRTKKLNKRKRSEEQHGGARGTWQNERDS
ncbi:hypothetical protein TNCV_1630861 [Trichonephila clavipes]|nr:hypothetical protein TNCV_1630861 [Trichonephila clavipes]